MISPKRAMHLALYTTLYSVASHPRELYPYAVPTPEQASALARAFGRHIDPGDADGVVPHALDALGRSRVVWRR